MPLSIPTGDYSIHVFMGDRSFSNTISIVGFTPQELQSLGHQGGGGGEGDSASLSPAILYSTDLNDILWEYCLAGNPNNANHLVLAAGHPHVSLDGGRTWTLANLGFQPRGHVMTEAGHAVLHGDPNMAISSDGTLFLVELFHVYGELNSVTGGILTGKVNSGVFTNSLIKKENVVTNGLSMDYTKLALDPSTNTVYVSSFCEIPFSNEYCIWKSTDSGKTFIKYSFGDLDSKYGVTMHNIQSMDVMPNGELIAGIRYYRSNEDDEDRVSLLRFNKDLSGVELVHGVATPMLKYSLLPIYKDSKRSWLLEKGPKIAVDRSDLHPGRIYIAWVEAMSTIPNPVNKFGFDWGHNADVFISYSDDYGKTWHEAIRVNDDSGDANQNFPSLRIDSEGTAHMSFLDKRENPDLPQYDVYYAKIVDGRVSRNTRVNEDHVYYWKTRDPGDYIESIAAYPSKVYIAHHCGNEAIIIDGIEMNSRTSTCIVALDPNLVGFPGEFFRGDANSDTTVDLSDAITILSYLFYNGNAPYCKDAADANDDGSIDVSDAVRVLNVLFQGETFPVPSPTAGTDLTEDSFYC
ncbi:MAG: dockerin type I domain-containing protein [Nanoarchaeota archaeon]|nr:dockerin type I domain-containing protein [Nanoarchaeota archaeon]